MKNLNNYNCVHASFHQGVFTYYIAQYELSEITGRPALVFVNGKGWNQEQITKEKYDELKGMPVIAGSALLNNGFFNFK